MRFFEEGFIKGFEAHGLDKMAAAGFVDVLKTAGEEIERKCKLASDFSGDKEFKAKLIAELNKQANFQVPDWLHNWLSQESGKESGGAQEMGVGGGAGGLLGLLLGNLTDHPMIGGLLGAGGGALLGHYMPQIAKYIQGMDLYKQYAPHPAAGLPMDRKPYELSAGKTPMPNTPGTPVQSNAAPNIPMPAPQPNAQQAPGMPPVQPPLPQPPPQASMQPMNMPKGITA